MSIEFHCSSCGKLIKAPDNAGGKRGKCPYCSHSAYIPLPQDELEEIPIAPISDEEEQRERELRRESIEYASAIKHAEGRSTDDDAAAGGDPVDFDSEVESFISAMHQSRLDDAEEAARRIKSLGREAKSRLKALASGDETLILANVPPPLVQAFLKNLLERV